MPSLQDNLQTTLLNGGINQDIISILAGTHKSVMINWIDPNGGNMDRTVHFINHYFGGRNYWEYRVLGSAKIKFRKWFLAGEKFNELDLADADFRMVVDDLDYQEYIQKFNPFTPVQTFQYKNKPKSYTTMPNPPHQDNKLVRVGSGNGYLHDVRFPSLKRGKPTWKRFWKLFPKYDGCYSLTEYYKKELQKLKDERDKLNELQAHI